MNANENKSKGQAVLEAIEGWIGSWVVFPVVPEGQALLLTLWAVHTWFAPSWPATAYLHITSEGPGCGKTTLMQVLASLSCVPRVRATLRAMAVVRDIEERQGAVTYFFDQVEALQASGRISDEQAILLTGYTVGGRHGISVGQKQVDFSTYCAKAFACIGDIAPDLQSRCMVTRLGFGVPQRVWTDAVGVRQAEADGLIYELGKAGFTGKLAWVPPSWLVGRNREIYTALWSVAVGLGLNEVALARVRRAIDDSIAFTASVERRSYRDVIGLAGTVDKDHGFAVQALRDLAKVLPEPTKTVTGDISSVHAVERLKAGDGPWRVFRGKGLDADMLGALLVRFIGTDNQGQVARRIRERAKEKQARGYRRADIMAALKVLEG
jgi:hypothetical protein